MQSVGQAGPVQPPQSSTAPASRPDAAASYRADWQGAATAPAAAAFPLAAAGAAPASPQGNSLHTNALLSEDVYRANPTPPAGTRVATAQDLNRLGLTPQMLEQPGQSTFRARVYVSGEPGQEHFTVAFRGSGIYHDSAMPYEDWAANFKQAFGFETHSFPAALEIGRQIARSGASVEMTGHSLGGGLASAAALAGGVHSTGFNSSGLHANTIDRANLIATAAGQAPGTADNYRVPGEILTAMQEGGDRVLGSAIGLVVGGWLGMPVTGAAAGALVDAPPAFGTQHDMPFVVPEGKNWFSQNNPIDRHLIDWVVAGADAMTPR